MKFTSTSLFLCLVGASSTQAFTLHTPNRSTSRSSFASTTKITTATVQTQQLSSSHLYSSLLEKPETEINVDEDVEVDANDETESVLAVSANHVFMNGRFIEGGQARVADSSSLMLFSSSATPMPNRITPIVYEDLHEEPDLGISPHDEIHDASTSTHDNISSSSFSQKAEAGHESSKTTNVVSNVIKMASVEEARELKGNDSYREAKVAEAMATKYQPVEDTSKSNGTSFTERVTNSGVASAAAMATAAVNAAVSMKTLEAPDVTKSYISLDSNKELDEDGLPLVYDKEAIEIYWKKEKGALNKRWGVFVGKAVPFLTRLTTLFIKDGKIDEKYIPELSERARIDLQDLGPTFIKAGQMMSVRPDVLPQATLDELTMLQDSVVPFPTSVAVEQIESELGGPLGQFFTSISEEPVAAASLAQVYLATLNDGKNTRVAVKVQRPDVLSTVSKDLYVLRRAAEVFQGLVERFAPQQKTNYVALLNEWSIGFYTELDFQNEARNQQRLRDNMKKNNVKGVVVPAVYEGMCTRRLLVSEWMDGIKLSDCSTEEIGTLIPVCQEAFLTQLFEDGFFHADPHPGNILRLNSPTEDGAVVALIDCGLMAAIDPVDRDNMISAVIHLANKDYASLVDDFINLEIIPTDSDRPTIIPLMDKALSPYVKGGGAKKYEAELMKLYGMEDTVQSKVGGFQAMTQDALTVLNDVPFSIPPYFAILGRAIVTLEGVALTGNPDYGIIMESYPFIARKLMSEDRPEIQKALQEVLYSGNDNGSIKFNRLLALLNNAAGAVATQDGAAFVDLDAVPEDGLSFTDGLKFLLSDNAESLRNLLESEVDSIVDLTSRQILRQGFNEAIIALSPPRPPSLPFFGDIFPPSPKFDKLRVPIILPSTNGNAASVGMLTLNEFKEIVSPKLSQDEEIYALSLSDAVGELFGKEAAEFVRGESVLSIKSVQLVLGAVRSGVLADSNVLSGDTAKSILENLGNLIKSVAGESDSSMESKLKTALSQLDDTERQRLDMITEEIVRRSIAKATERLENVPRLF